MGTTSGKARGATASIEHARACHGSWVIVEGENICRGLKTDKWKRDTDDVRAVHWTINPTQIWASNTAKQTGAYCMIRLRGTIEPYSYHPHKQFWIASVHLQGVLGLPLEVKIVLVKYFRLSNGKCANY
jgi:hypothetical protein